MFFSLDIYNGEKEFLDVIKVTPVNYAENIHTHSASILISHYKKDHPHQEQIALSAIDESAML